MRVAALFPGQGSHTVGMGIAFYRSSEAARDVLDRAEAAIPGLLELMFDGPAETLTLTANQQPALVAAGAAAYAAWRESGGPKPVVAAGHSLGEFTAHVAAGSLSLEQAIRLVRARGSYMQDAVAPGVGAMAAILKLDAVVVERLCAEARSSAASSATSTSAGMGGTVEIANLNAPGQVVVSGNAGPVAAVAEAAKAHGGRAVPLKVSAPFHCSLMLPAARQLASELAEAQFEEPSFPVVCNVTAEPLGAPHQAAEVLERQVTSPVRWTESIEAIAAMGVDRFVELGSGKVLTGLVGRTIPAADARPAFDPDSLAAALNGGDKGGEA